MANIVSSDQIGSALARLTKNSWPQQEECYAMLLKIIGNIAEHPADVKFRNLKTTSAALKDKVLDVPGAWEFLLAVGFTESDNGKVLTLPGDQPTSKTAANLSRLQQHVSEAKARELRRQRDARIAEVKEEEKHVHNKFTRHVHLTEEQRQQLERDRAEFEADRAAHPTLESHAKDLHFGAKPADKSFLRP